jgi:hypothetical protein
MLIPPLTQLLQNEFGAAVLCVGIPLQMALRFVVASKEGHWEGNLKESHCISTMVAPYEHDTAHARAFGLPDAEAKPVELGGWVGAVAAGASVNCPVRLL